MAMVGLISVSSCCRSTKPVLGTGRLCWGGSSASLEGEPKGCTSWGGNLPEAISSLRARTEASGSAPSSRCSVSRSRSYWSKACPERLEKA